MRSNYIDILSQKVEIPIIQRDYAQGRTDSKTNKIRKDFLDVLFHFIEQKAKDLNAEIELDFIYGFNEGDEKQQSQFVPIDGQQRLTTLWLLYWFVAVKENIGANEKTFLSNFVYETRHSTTQFCKKLIKFPPAFSNSSISSEIKNQSWYFETWDYDPSIQAMLVVLDDIENRYTEIGWNSVWQKIGSASCPFYFYKLDMKKVGLTDDLYIKMNSRGKPLTEFEYFKAGFSELISDTNKKKKFEESVDGKWIDTIWHIVIESGTLNKEDDIALTVDNAFLNLFNFITSVIAFKKDIKTVDDIRYTDTVKTAELLAIIYSDSDNQTFLFDTLDAICNQQNQNHSFWSDTFYFGKANFNTQKARLFFQHNELNLLKRCLFNYAEIRGFSFPDQLLLFACFTQFKNPQKEFADRIRTVRNLVVNSENELRESILGNSFEEVEIYIRTGDLNVLKDFKTDQIDEEKQKEHFLKNSSNAKQFLQQLEDSDILRGSISLFPLNSTFVDRAKKFLELFDEDDFVQHFNQKSNLLLCFGDYSQDDGTLSNLMAGSKSILRGFMTTPGYNKNDFYSKTRGIMIACLDFFKTNTTISVEQKIADTISNYATDPKDWRYYFMKYDSFREQCHYGYYQCRDDHYCIWKMGKKQFNGYHWDPFLHDVFLSLQPSELILENYGDRLLINTKSNKIWISTVSNGFHFEDASGAVTNNVLNNLRTVGKLNSQGVLEVTQNSDSIDLEDRLEKLKQLIKTIIQV
jgi:hypothetical protein